MADAAGFCRELAASEPLVGTAQAGITRWVALEDARAWGAKVPRDTELPAFVKDWLGKLEAEDGTRLQMIRRPGTRCEDRRKLVLARAPADPAARRIVELDVTLDELPSLDPDALLDRAAPAPDIASLWLVCTHGARDRCCAKWGVALFEAMRRRVEPTRVWQCSHLGGHRFAPTMLALPSGLLWGRVELTEVDDIVLRAGEGRIGALAKLRGRSCYEAQAQAAECLVRVRDGLDGDRGGVTIASDGVVRVEVDGRAGQVILERVEPGFATPISCGEGAEPRPWWRLG